MTDCQLVDPLATCGPVKSMERNATYWYEMFHQERLKCERLEKEANLLAVILIGYGHIIGDPQASFAEMKREWRKYASKAVEENTNDK